MYGNALVYVIFKFLRFANKSPLYGPNSVFGKFDSIPYLCVCKLIEKLVSTELCCSGFVVFICESFLSSGAVLKSLRDSSIKFFLSDS